MPDWARGLLEFVRGSTSQGKGELDEAIKAYRKAIEDPKFDSPGNAWYNLGTVYRTKGELAETIKAYRKATEYSNLLTPGYVWNNLGLALHEKGELDEAIKAFHHALADPTNDVPAKAWASLADIYIEKGTAVEAVEAFNNALDSKDPIGADHARARLGLQQLKAKLKPAALSPDDRALTETKTADPSTDGIESGVIAAIKQAENTQYEKYVDKPDCKRTDTLSTLRGWSSAVTLLEGSERRWRGGGYFLKWRGFGIVIDPGFDFLRNFHDAGYHGREIHAVVVSHNHPDHNSDLKPIDDLRYELYKRLANPDTLDFKPYILLWDEDTSRTTTFGSAQPQHQYSPVVMGSGFPHPVDLSKHPAQIPVRVTPFKVNHSGDVPHALGMVVELLDEKGKSAVRIGYTADTGYFENLHKHLEKCDVLIAHISQPSIEELQDATKLKNVHLGYRGTARLLRECQPKLALIGEFWAGYADLRISLTKGLRQRSGLSAVLPTALAMHIRLPSLDIECTECGEATPFAHVKVAPPTDTFGSLAYLCPGCMIG